MTIDKAVAARLSDAMHGMNVDGYIPDSVIEDFEQTIGEVIRSVGNATYVRGDFIKTPANEAAIRAAATALAIYGGGTILLPPQTITLTSPLPILSGIRYEGVAPVVVAQNLSTPAYLADMEWNYAGGTVLVGNGTFSAFEANGTALGSPADPIGATQISNCGVENVGIDNVTYGVKVGNANVMGAVWSSFKNIYVKNATQWGVWLVNFQHCEIDRIHTTLCQNGQYYGNLLPKTVLMCGNSIIGELFHMMPRDGRDNRLCRHVVFESGGTLAQLNELLVHRVQSNCMNRTKLSVTASFTSGSTSVTVPDGTKFLAGMTVVFTTTGNGFTLNQVYLVASVSGNTLTFANDRVSAAISATGTGNLTLETYGFPNVEVTRQNSGASVRNSRFHHIDLEGSATAALYVDGAESNRYDVSELPITGSIHQGIVGRSAKWSEFFSEVAAPTDFDSSSTSSSYRGFRGPITGRVLSGSWIDNTTQVAGMSIGGGALGQTSADLQSRSNGFIYPAVGMGEAIRPRDSALTLTGSWVGDVIFAGSSTQTFTLPTIVTDASSPAASQIGQWFDICNVGTATLTVVTDGTQLFNKVAAKTSLTVAAQNGLKVIACKDNSGNLFWVARAYALA